MNILSIDYDFFQNTELETMTKFYPDGHDLPTSLTEITWADYYVNPRSAKRLEKVTLNREELDICKDLLCKQSGDIPVLIVNSHRHIYEFIHEFCEIDDMHTLDHVDMHHDMFNENDKIDCGNWLRFILDEYGTENMLVQWVSNPLSFEAFGIADKIKTEGINTPTSMACLQEKIYDMIFICRSDTWSPPHLDNGFAELVETAKNHFYIIKIEESVMKPRNLEPVISQLNEVYKNCQGKSLEVSK